MVSCRSFSIRFGMGGETMGMVIEAAAAAAATPRKLIYLMELENHNRNPFACGVHSNIRMWRMSPAAQHKCWWESHIVGFGTWSMCCMCWLTVTIPMGEANRALYLFLCLHVCVCVILVWIEFDSVRVTHISLNIKHRKAIKLAQTVI